MDEFEQLSVKLAALRRERDALNALKAEKQAEINHLTRQLEHLGEARHWSWRETSQAVASAIATHAP